MSLSSKLRATILAASALMLGACSYNPNDYSCFADIAPGGWDAGQTLLFMPQPADSAVSGTLSLLVRHTNDYPYSNLWVELTSQQPADSGHIAIRRDTLCIELADVYGNWYGTGAGTSFQLKDTIATDFTLIRNAPLRLRHIMRPQSVGGLEQVGIIFEANRQK